MRAWRLLVLVVVTVLISYQAYQFATDRDSEQVEFSQSLPTIRVGVLVSGSVHWQVETIINNQFDVLNGLRVEVVALGSVNALLVALQGDAVDMIVSNWVWVASQRAQQREFKFYPFSTALGSVVVPRASDINDLGDVVGKQVGIAGGPDGKSWLLLKALAQQEYGIDIAALNTIKFVAPPLVNALLANGKMQVGLNYWHFNAVLDEDAYRTILTKEQFLKPFDVDGDVPMLGWAFKASWAKQNRSLVNNFLNASKLAARKLNESDDAWSEIEYLFKDTQKQHLSALKEAFRNNIAWGLSDVDIQNIQSVFNVLQRNKLEFNKNTDDTAKLSAIDGGELFAQLPLDLFWQLEK